MLNDVNFVDPVMDVENIMKFNSFLMLLTPLRKIGANVLLIHQQNP